MSSPLPLSIESEEQLDQLLSEPSPELIQFMKRLKGDIMILGAAGKMGFNLSQLAVRAVEASGVSKKVWAVSRFSKKGSREHFEKAGIGTLPADFLDLKAVQALPRAENVIFMAGRKFGTEEGQDLTWASNTLIPAHIGQHFVKSRIVAFSTGCVYPLVTPQSGGCTEKEPPFPIGEYTQSCLGRERLFEYFSRKDGTPVCLYRLNYAIDLRYGVLHDIASSIWNEKPVALSSSHFNCIWQGSANEIALRALEHCSSPPFILNVTGPGMHSTRETAEIFGKIMKKPVRFVGKEEACMYLNNAEKALSLFGKPRVDTSQLIEWTAQWVMHGGKSLGLPTHFEVTDGKF